MIPLNPRNGLLLGVGIKVASGAIEFLGNLYGEIKAEAKERKLQKKKLLLAEKKIPVLKRILPNISALEKRLRKSVYHDAQVKVALLSNEKHKLVLNGLINQFETLCRLRRIGIISNILLEEFLYWTKKGGRSKQLLLPDPREIIAEEEKFLLTASKYPLNCNGTKFVSELSMGACLLVFLSDKSQELQSNKGFCKPIIEIVNSQASTYRLFSVADPKMRNFYQKYLSDVQWIRSKKKEKESENLRVATLRLLIYILILVGAYQVWDDYELIIIMPEVIRKMFQAN